VTRRDHEAHLRDLLNCPHYSSSLRTTLLSPHKYQRTIPLQIHHTHHAAAIMTRAQQAISIGLLITSVRKSLPFSKLHSCVYQSRTAQHKLTHTIALPVPLSPTHPTTKLDFKRNNTRRTSCLRSYFCSQSGNLLPIMFRQTHLTIPFVFL